MFSRRIFHAVVAVAALGFSLAAQALTIKPYSPADLAAAQNAGAPVALHFYADWCPSCKDQSRAFESLKADPALAKLTILVVDYDKAQDLRKSLTVRTQSTVVVFKGKTEVARNAGDTDPAKLKATLVQGL